MLARFQGPDGTRKLLGVLQRQPLAHSGPDLARQFLESGTLRHFPSGAAVISQGGTEDSLFLLCAGTISVRVNGREIARRGPGEHVGEMALLDPSSPRSATLVAVDEVVAVEVPEPEFTAIAEAHPGVWRSLARVLGSRLRERGQMVQTQRERPRLFIGSSAEGLPIARAVEAGLAYDDVDVTLWTSDVFAPTRQTLEALEALLPETDFALLVLTADDVVRSRGRQGWAPRDNLVFELGLFCGALGRGRSYMLLPREKSLKLPSDLLGLTPILLKPGTEAELPSRVGPVCTTLRSSITVAGPR